MLRDRPRNRAMDVNVIPPPAILLQMMTGYWVSKAIYVAAKLGIANLVAERSVSCEELASATNSHAPSLYRVLRALASVGVFTETAPGRFALTPLADLLRSETPDSIRALAITYNEELYRAWDEVLHSVKTGQPAFEHRFGMPVFDYYAQHTESDRILNKALVGYTTQVANAVVSTYDFAPFAIVVDVGGGYGVMLEAILHATPTAQGILFDQPHVVAAAAEHVMAAGVADRCARIGGDFFASVPGGGDAYLLSQILHDWDDERCVTILTRCRQAMPRHGKLLVVEIVLPLGEEPSFGKWLDLHMLVVTSGSERTAAEYEALFRAAGFALGRVVPTQAGPSVVEAIPI